MRSVDLFAGAGGLTKGAERAGVEVVAAVELDQQACETFRVNFPSAQVIREDARDIDFSPWRGDADLVIGGPPCQPFSVAGRHLSFSDPRDCVPQFVRAVSEVEPDAFIMENVPGLCSPRHRGYLATVLQSLEELGYQVSYDILDAADYGVPQHRKRLFLVGARNGRFIFPRPTHGPKGSQPHMTAREALQDAPEDIPNTAKTTYAKKPVLRPQPWDGMMVNGGGRPINLDEPSQTIPASAGGNRTHIIDLSGVLSRYHLYLLEGGAPFSGEVTGVRRLTVAESASLQSFPESHVFLGKQSSRYAQVGNAVPPLLAQKIITSLRSQLSGQSDEAAIEEQDLSPTLF